MVYAIIVCAVVFLLMAIVLYNTLIRRKNDVENAFASIDAMLKKRYDLIPAIVDAVKGYMNYEKDLLTKITSLRVRALSQNLSNEERIIIENEIMKGLSDINVAVENYPDLKANQNFLQLQEELSDIENKLAASRRFFNAATAEYNNAVESFPGNLVARNFGFQKEIMFDLGTDTRKQLEEPPKIQF